MPQHPTTSTAGDTRGPRPVRPPASLYKVPDTGTPVDLFLNGNEGAVPSAELFDRLARHGTDVLRRYPDTGELERRFAARHGVDAEHALVTAGGDDAIDRICRAYLAPGREIVMTSPTFEMIPRYAELAGAAIRTVPWRSGPFPGEGVADLVTPDTAVVVVVSPNNPTGGVATRDDIAALAAAAPGALLLVDLAYAEFAADDLTPAALEHANAVVIRTLSKAYGLAGLRIGLALGEPAILRELRRSGAPYAVARPSIALALARLDMDDEDSGAATGRFVTRITVEREQLGHTLRALGAEPVPSQGNFILARFADAEWAQEGLAGLGIAVRRFPGREGLEDDLRITCPGHPASFERLVAALEATLAPDAILFDMDGVVADVSRSYRRAIELTARDHGVELESDAISRAKAAGNANDDWQLTRQLLAERGVDVALDDVIEQFEKHYQGCDGQPGLYRHETLCAPASFFKDLAARLPLAVVTGRPRHDAERFLTDHGIADAFEVVVTAEDAPSKPDPAPVLLALDKLGYDRAWMIGDTPDDIRAARAAGVVPLGILSNADQESLRDPMRQAGAARVLTSLDQIAELLP